MGCTSLASQQAHWLESGGGRREGGREGGREKGETVYSWQLLYNTY